MQNYFDHHAFGFWLGLLIVVILVALALLYATIRQEHARTRYESILRSVDSDDIPSMLTEYLVTVRKIALRAEEMEQRVGYLYETLPAMVRHVGLVRFRPFQDTGGNQSFSLALLDGEGNGVVLSALHSRRDHRLYAKPVTGRASTYPLTEEEQRAIRESVAVETGMPM